MSDRVESTIERIVSCLEIEFNPLTFQIRIFAGSINTGSKGYQPRIRLLTQHFNILPLAKAKYVLSKGHIKILSLVAKLITIAKHTITCNPSLVVFTHKQVSKDTKKAKGQPDLSCNLDC
jgi:hypothetical protein